MTRVTCFWHSPRLQMTKTELQSALAEGTQTDKRTVGVFLDPLSLLAYNLARSRQASENEKRKAQQRSWPILLLLWQSDLPAGATPLR